MKLAVSNIAWDPADDEAVARLLGARGLAGLEVAPTKVWPRPLAVGAAEIRAYRRFWEARGIRIVALQALLYGRPDLTIFEREARRQETLEHLAGLMRVGSLLGATALVFGSPRNRRRGRLARAAAEAIAVRFFREAGALAERHGVVLCIEPNPVESGCDFVTTVREGLALVERVASPGFGLHLDAAALALSGEPVAATIERAAGAFRHFHASEPRLGPLGRADVDHAAMAAALRRVAYDGWVSAEMRHDPEGDALAELDRALGFLGRTYG